MKYCKKCLTPDTRPRISFKDGVCNACVFAEEKRRGDVNYNERETELNNHIAAIKEYSSSNGNVYDCIIPWSGGKDSSAVAIHLKEDFGLNPLLIRFNPLIPTKVGIHNCREVLNHGFDSMQINLNVSVSRKLCYRFFLERGNPKLHWDAGIASAIFKIAIDLKLPYIFYAEHGETNYGGRVLHKNSEKIRDYEEIIENLVGDNPRNWVDGDNITPRDLYQYVMPTPSSIKKNGIEAHYYGYYRKWNVKENYRYVASKINFKTAERGRTYGTFTNYDSLDDYTDDLYYYLNYIKFGYGRGIRDLSRHIQNEEITREEAIILAQKYDGEFPEESIPPILDYMGIDRDEFNKIVDSHRTPSNWSQSDGRWINILREKLMHEKI